ncbi:MAG: PAS domain-containing hybrid sensor histidine kinase/response regulator, partial [Rhodospirillaceae bacterium]
RESQFASILESSMDVIMRVEETGRITLVNERGAALLDTDKASLIGQRLGDVLPSPSGAALEARVYKVCVSGLPDSYLEMRDGRWFEYRLAPMDPEANGYRAVTVICRDMTPERRLEQEVRQRERFNRLIADNLPGLVLYVDRSEMLRFVNDRIVDWTGQPSTELIGRRIEEVLVPSIGQEVLRHRAQALSGRVAEFEASFTDSQGRGVRYHASLLPHQDDDGRVLGFVGLLLDISTRHEAEQATRSALDAAEQANSAKTRFLAAASHDLRQPMQALNIYINLLRAKTRDMEELDDLVRRASLSLDALGGLLDNLLDISKLEAGIIQAQPGTVPLQDLFDRMDAEMRPQFERKGLELRFSLCACTVRSDAVLLERVVRNLLTNALRYTHRGGVMLSCRKRSETVLLQVWDTGIGIPADRLELIFEEFYQIGNEERDRRQGLGVGLAIVRRLSALLEHDLSVRSVVDKGTVFTLVLPREVAVPDAEQRLEAGAALQRSASPEGAEDLSGRIICAIDDDPDVLDGLALQLEAWGVSVIAAGDLAEALEFLRDEERPPDVVMADYRLANGAKGTAAIRTIRLAFGSEIPGVVLTGDTSPDRLREVSAAGVHLLHKPVKSQDLQETLSEALKAKSA